MKNFLITLLAGLVACASAYGVFYVMNGAPALHRAAGRMTR